MTAASHLESLRKLYYELVKGRVRTQVALAEAKGLSHPPIFLVGVARSGTTLLRYLVDSHSRICCPPESDFISFLEPLLEDPQCTTGFEGMGFSPEHVRSRLRDFVAYFFENYAAAHGKPRWADKTPRYVDHLDLLERVFPEAVFVVIHRHGLDVASSATRNGKVNRYPGWLDEAGADFRLAAVKHWTEKTSVIKDFVQRHPEKVTEIGYEDLCARPEQTLRPAFQLIGEEWESSILEFHRFDHDLGKESGRIVGTRGFEVSEGNWRRWPVSLQEKALEIAGPQLLELGYPVSLVP